MLFNKWLNLISVRNKLLLFLVIPVFTLLFFVFDSINKEMQTLHNEKLLAAHFQAAFALSHLITELQNERGLTEGFLNNINKNLDLPLLTQQWRKANLQLKQFRQYYNPHKSKNNSFPDNDWVLQNRLIQFNRRLKQRSEFHRSILQNNGKTSYFENYSQIINQGIEIISVLDSTINDIQRSKLTTAYIALLQLQEETGQERGLLNGITKSQKINMEKIRSLSGILSSQRIYFNNFQRASPIQYVQDLEKKLKHPFVIDVELVRDDILNKISRHELLNDLQQIIGYGGLIHLFKNYVIRGDKNYEVQFKQRFKELEVIINTFPYQKSTTQNEKQLFQHIVATFEQYNRLLETVSQQKKEQSSIEEIDHLVKVNDEFALKAIKQLKSKVTYYDISDWWEKATFKVYQYTKVSYLLEKEINNLTQSIIKNATRRFTYFILLALVTLLSTLFLGYLLFRRLVTDVTSIAHTMNSMQLNDDEKHHLLPIEGNDEISQMSRAFNHLIVERVKFENQLQSALKNAQAGLVAKGQFLSTMSHEIRTPLNGVLGMAELLSQTQLNKEQQDYIATIINSGHLLLNIINDILDFSKLEAHSVTLEHISFNLEKTAFDTLQLLAANAAEKKIELIFNYPVNAPRHFMGDPSRLRQILLNLINNAIKFTHTGHVLLTISIQEEKNKHYRLTFSVQDTGIGIEHKNISKLFDSFTQAEQSTTRKFGGTGLGLSICKQLVGLMGGSIQIESTLGKGSHFSFSLVFPVSDHFQKLLVADLHNIRVLVVDDNPINLSIFDKFLQHYKIEVVLLNDPEQVMAELYKSISSNHLFDIILLDHHMPDISGIDLAKTIRENSEFDSVKLALFTSGGLKGDAKKVHEMGFSAYHTKPLRSDILINSIINILASKKDKGSIEQLVTNYNIEEAIELKQENENKTYKGHILLTEDNVVNQKVALAVLKKLQLSVDIANDGKEAVEKCQKKHYDLIFMDCLMPNMDGFEATRSIRENNQNHQVPIIALTANALIENEEKCHAAGMSDFISKPFKRNDITKVLDRWLDQSP